MSYDPKPGTTAFQVIAYLESLPAGAEVMTSKIAESIGVPHKNVTPCLDTAVQAGLLFKRQRDDHVRAPFWWSLTDRSGGKPPPKRQLVYVPDEQDSRPADLVSAGVGSQKPNGGVHGSPAKAGRESAHSLPTVGGRRSCSMGENGQSPLLTPASLHNGREQIKPVSGLPEQSAPELAPRKKGQPEHTPRGADRVRQVLKADPERDDATDCRARSKVMAPQGSESPTGRGDNVAPALGAAPVFLQAGPRGSAATAGEVNDDQGNSGRACRMAGAGHMLATGSGWQSGAAGAADRAAEHGAGLLRAQPHGTAHQGNAASRPDVGLTGAGVDIDAVHAKPEGAAAIAGGPQVAAKPRTKRIHEQPDPQQVLKAEGASPDATDRGTPAMASPRVGAMGVGQPADAGPAGDLRIALWSDGVLFISGAKTGQDIALDANETRQLLNYLDRLREPAT